MVRLVKWGVLGLATSVLVGLVCFGKDCFSYATSSFRMLRGSVRSAVPLEFELERARQLLADLVPELQAKVVLVAQEEVTVDELERELVHQRRQIDVARAGLKQTKAGLAEPVAYVSEGAKRREAVNDLARRFSNLRLAEQLLQGKEKVLLARRQSLGAAVEALKTAQVRKIEVEAEIERLEGEVRLLKAQSRIPPVAVDHGSLEKAERLVAELRKRLDLAQKVLVTEPVFAPPAEIQEPEAELFARIDAYLASDLATAPAKN